MSPHGSVSSGSSLSLRTYAAGALDPDHPLYDLQTLTALTSTRPELLAACADPDDAEQVLRALQNHAGEDAHAELIETEGTLLLRAELPGLTLAAWLPLSRALSLRPHPAWLLPADDPTRLACRLLGLLRPEPLALGDLTAVRWLTDAGATVPEPCRTLPLTHPVLLTLRDDLRAALGPAWLPEDAVQLVVRDRDGRIGLRLAPTTDDPAALQALAQVVHDRAAHPELRLAPDPSWQARLGTEIVLWLLIPPSHPLPTGDPGPFGPALPPGPLAAACRLEAIAPAADHLSLAARLDQLVPDLDGEGQAWTSRDAHPVAVVTWSAPTPVDLSALPAPTRWLPAIPRGLATVAHHTCLHPHRATDRWLVRCHDVLRAADLVEETTPRPTDDLDRAWVAALLPHLEAAGTEPAPEAGERWVEPVLDSEERPGLRLRLHRAHHLSPQAFHATLDALGGPMDQAERFASVAFTRGELWISLWRAGHPILGEPRRWR